MKGFEDSIIKSVDYSALNRGKGRLIHVPKSPVKGYNFSYMLFVPEYVENNTSLIVEPANPYTYSDFDNSLKFMIDSVNNSGSIVQIFNKKTNFPVLIPIFPRDVENDETIYTDILSENSFAVSNPYLKRVDRQLVNMITDAIDRFEKFGMIVDKKVIIHGFSASAKFANRFTLLHPEIVKLCIGGAVGGNLVLPIRELGGGKLLYPVGVGDVPEVTNEKISEFLNVKQFYYQGLQDENDAFASANGNGCTPKFKGIISSNSLAQLYRFLGSDMNGDRWFNTQKIYRDLGANVQFETYINSGHEPFCATEKIEELLLQEVYQDNITK